MDRKEYFERVKRIETVCREYNYMKKVVHPYDDCPMSLKKLIAMLKNYDGCTDMSKSYLRSCIAPVEKIITSWAKYDNKNEPKIKIVGRTGIIKEVPESIANEYLKIDGIRLVDM